MVDFIVRTAITAVALYVALELVPQMHLEIGRDWWKLIAVAVVFGIINSLVKPVVKMAALPVRLMTMGLISFVINAAMLLLVAYVATRIGLSFEIGAFPPKLDSEAIVGALLGAIVVSIVSTALGAVDFGRRLVT
jgi:putative membrane protein